MTAEIPNWLALPGIIILAILGAIVNSIAKNFCGYGKDVLSSQGSSWEITAMISSAICW